MIGNFRAKQILYFLPHPPLVPLSTY